MKHIFRFAGKYKLHSWAEVFLFLRGLAFLGFRYTCPCCGWKLRAFTKAGASFRVRHLGYCPRCHAKARHRRIWLFLERKTNLFKRPLRLLHVSPEYCFSRRLKKMKNLDYVGVDIYDYLNISVKMDLVSAPIRSDTFDAIICIHVLEHVQDDRMALKELYRVLKPDGWAVVSVPIRWNQKTHEDPTVISEEEREHEFGETEHVRIYGYDFVDRLEECGFQAQPDLGRNVDQQIKGKYGLRDDEDIFLCRKKWKAGFHIQS